MTELSEQLNRYMAYVADFDERAMKVLAGQQPRSGTADGCLG